MSEKQSDSDSDAPEEVTAQQGLQQFEEITQAQKQSKARAVREVKERRRKWAEKLTPRPRQEGESVEDDVVETTESQPKKQGQDKSGMLPDDIVKLIAAQEKKVFSSDSEEDESQNKLRSKKKQKKSGNGPVILKDIPPAQCLQNSLDFINKRRMQIPRSSAVLKNLRQGW